MPETGTRTRATYAGSITRALDWLAAQQGVDGSFGLSVEDAINPIMITPLAYLWGGRPCQCKGVLDRIRSIFLKDDGTLHRPAYKKKLTDQRQEPYALGWVVRSAAACGALDMAHRCARHLAPFQHEPSGGLFGTPSEAKQGEGVIDMTSTGVGGLALLAAGEFARAAAAGDYVVRWLETQPDPGARLLMQWDTQRGLLDEESGKALADNANAPLVIGHQAPHTGYWLCGIQLAFLAELAQVTGTSTYLEAARAIFEFARCSSLLGRVCSSHKFAWGAARLYAVTRDPRHIDGACLVADWLIQNQRPDGAFVFGELSDHLADLPLVAKVDVTSQFTAWVSAAVMHLPAD